MAADQGGGEVGANAPSVAATLTETALGFSVLDVGGIASGDMPAAKSRRKLTGAAAEFSRRSERDAERRLNEIMQTERIGEMNFPGENSLTDMLDKLSSDLSESLGTPIAIKPDLRSLDEDSIILADVLIKDIAIPADLMTICSALDYILEQTNPQLTWIAKDELLLITTVDAAESDENLFLRSYDISRLRAISQLTVTAWTGGAGGQGGGGAGFFSVSFVPTQFGGGGMGGGGQPALQKTAPSKPDTRKSKTDDPKQQIMITWEAGLISTIQDMTGPPTRWYDIDGEGGRMSIAGNRLLVRQSRRGHEQVVAVLEQLELAAEDAAAEAAQ